MRTTLAIDDTLLSQAQELTGIDGTTALVRKALQTLIELEASRRLALMGGSAPDFPEIPRRRIVADENGLPVIKSFGERVTPEKKRTPGVNPK